MYCHLTRCSSELHSQRTGPYQTSYGASARSSRVPGLGLTQRFLVGIISVSKSYTQFSASSSDLDSVDNSTAARDAACFSGGAETLIAILNSSSSKSTSPTSSFHPSSTLSVLSPAIFSPTYSDGVAVTAALGSTFGFSLLYSRGIT